MQIAAPLQILLLAEMDMGIVIDQPERLVLGTELLLYVFHVSSYVFEKIAELPLACLPVVGQSLRVAPGLLFFVGARAGR